TKKKRSSAAIALVAVLLVGIAAAGGVLAWTMLGPRVNDPQATYPEPTTAAPIAAEPAIAEPAIVEPAVAEAPTTGSVFIESTPPGATITLGDRENAGLTPLEIGMMEPGTYDVRLSLEGRDEWRGQVEIAAGERASVRAELERTRRDRPAPSPPGQLSLNTRPWSKVYLG